MIVVANSQIQWSRSFQAGLGLVMESNIRTSLTGNYVNNPKQAGSSLAGLAGNYLNEPLESNK